MPAFALNHMTVARASFAELIDVACAAGAEGVEARTDLSGPLFDGLDPAEAGRRLRDAGLRLFALAEVKRFNDWSDARAEEAAALIATARAAGAEGVALIPRNDGGGMGNGERQANLRIALRELEPMLKEAGLKGLVEPLGFASCALRHKQEAVDVITALGAEDTFALVHDTFHHALAGGGPIFAGLTGMVHVSGVTDPGPTFDEMEDAHRVLVDGADRLGNVAQLRALAEAGYDGPVSFECFAPEVHGLSDPVAALRGSMEHLNAGLQTVPA
ncbi:TIM barrel protein [Histidinibacterium lentulum]|uniref:Sugar epimerase n=1 Tax=Histidinibacterium lentulum TaxID=2480588 RepID=A0A3N2QTC6_9RHOB|nr:TIM barrel protein [Histidinibacterium lentulum]ROT98471.1 sugar epimerase [Histidinibacterium lentulum]